MLIWSGPVLVYHRSKHIAGGIIYFDGHRVVPVSKGRVACSLVEEIIFGSVLFPPQW